jgi:hypothetical protein
VEKFSLLSREKGFIISALFDINEKNANYLTQKLREKLSQLYGNPKKTETINKDKRIKYLLYYENGCVWEFDDFRTTENSFALKKIIVFAKNVLSKMIAKRELMPLGYILMELLDLAVEGMTIY